MSGAKISLENAERPGGWRVSEDFTSVMRARQPGRTRYVLRRWSPIARAWVFCASSRDEAALRRQGEAGE